MNLHQLTRFNAILSAIDVNLRNLMKNCSLFQKRQNSIKGFWYLSSNKVLHVALARQDNASDVVYLPLVVAEKILQLPNLHGLFGYT